VSLKVKMKMLRTPAFAAALLTSVAAIGLAPAWAQSTPAPENPAAARNVAHHPAMEKLTRAQLVDGRIALLKTELKITPAQEAQWQSVAAALRQNAQSLDEAAAAARPRRGAQMNAVERMERQGAFAKIRADNDARLLAAFKPLYAGLSPDQQHIANALMGGHHHGWRHGWHHRA
jgi:hypothetical protein